MPKQRHGCSFTSRWTRIACVLASLNCDNRIVESVYQGIANETCELFMQQEHKELCVKTFGPQRIQEYEVGFLMWKNGFVVAVEIIEATYVNSEDIDYTLWVDTFLNFHYNRVIIDEHGNGLHANVRSLHYTETKLKNKAVIKILNNLALLSRCDFRFWGIVLKQIGYNTNEFFLKPVVTVEPHFRIQLALHTGFIAIICSKTNEGLARGLFYYHPMKPNVEKLLVFLEHTKQEWILQEPFGDYIERICQESETPEIRKFFQENQLK